MKKNNAMTLRPFHFVTPSIFTMTGTVLCVLVPHILMLFFSASFDSLLIIFATLLSSCLAEAIDAFLIRKKDFNIPVTLLQGVLIGMFLPSTYPVVTIFIIVFVTLFIAKYSFGGIAGAWVNPIAFSIVMAYFIGSIWFPTFIIAPHYLQSNNTSLMLINDGLFPICSFDAPLTSFLNNTIFSHLGVNIPEGYVSMMWDTGAIIPAFRFNFFTLIGSLVLFSTRCLSWEVPLSFIITYCFMVWLLCPVFAGGSLASGDIILALFTGGTLFAAFFVLSWFGTVPMTPTGKIIFGVTTGMASFLISGYGLSAVGAMFSVFCGNIFSLIIQMLEHLYSEKQLSLSTRPHHHLEEHN